MATKTIAIVGDLHSKVSLLNDLVEKRPYIRTILQVGDLGLFYSTQAAQRDSDWKRYSNPVKDIIEFKPEMSRPVHFIKGNHEDFEMLKSPLLKDLNFHYIAQGSVKKFGQYKVGFLGGIYSPKKFEKPSEELLGRQKRFYTKEEINTLKKNSTGGIDILITHEGPRGFINKPGVPHNEGTQVIRDLMEDLSPKYLIHGHHHWNYEAQYRDTKIIGLGNLHENEHSFKLI